MPTQLSFDALRTAVLSMDFQSAIVSIYTKDQEGLLANTASVLKGARRCGMTIIHVQVGFRPKLPEINSRNILLSAIKSSEKHRTTLKTSV